MLGSGLALIIGVVLIGYYWAVGSALNRLRRSMERVQDGNRAHRAEKAGPKEISVLAEALNDMLDATDEAESQMREEQESRIELEKRLQRSKRLAAIGQLAAGVAHELGTPLSVIRGRAQRTLRSPNLPAKIVRSFEETQREVGRMESIVRQLLDFARPASHSKRPVAPRKLLHDVMLRVEEDLRNGRVSVEVRPGGSDRRMEVDPSQAVQAITNLTENAIQAARSRVRLAWREREKEGCGAIIVDDDGEGIGPEVSVHLFEPFFTTKPVGEGTGLGLAIAHSIARENGGRIDVGESPLGGARFELILPLSSELES
jgi:signal transduction histidine kinase